MPRDAKAAQVRIRCRPAPSLRRPDKDMTKAGVLVHFWDNTENWAAGRGWQVGRVTEVSSGHGHG